VKSAWSQVENQYQRRARSHSEPGEYRQRVRRL
jgi:hypothetical protein